MITEMWSEDCIAIYSDCVNSDDEHEILGIASVDNTGKKYNRQEFSIKIRPECLNEEVEQVKKIAMEFIISKY